MINYFISRDTLLKNNSYSHENLWLNIFLYIENNYSFQMLQNIDANIFLNYFHGSIYVDCSMMSHKRFNKYFSLQNASTCDENNQFVFYYKI